MDLLKDYLCYIQNEELSFIDKIKLIKIVKKAIKKPEGKKLTRSVAHSTYAGHKLVTKYHLQKKMQKRNI